jgi:pyruvate dehydrogenase E1 component alpha subunit
VEEHRKRDPLTLLKEAMPSQAQCSESDVKQLEREVGDAVAAAVKFADESPFPDPASLHADILAED